MCLLCPNLGIAGTDSPCDRVCVITRCRARRQSIIILFVVYVLLWIFTARGRANAQAPKCVTYLHDGPRESCLRKVQADIDYVGDFVLCSA